MKKRFLFSFLLLVYICSLQVVHSDPRRRVELDRPFYGARIDRSHRLTRDIIACFLFNERIGSRANDIATNILSEIDGYGSDPLYIQAAASPNDPEFDGTVGWRFSSARATRADNAVTRKITDVFTIAMWVMPTSNVNGYIFHGEEPSGSLHIIWYPQDGTFKGFSAQSGAPIQTPTWATSKRVHAIGEVHHVAVTADGSGSGNTLLYVNNELQDIGAAKTSAHNTDWRLGSSFAGAAPVDMVIYSLYIWNRVLTATDIEELYLDPYCLIEELPDGIGMWAAISAAVSGQVIMID